MTEGGTVQSAVARCTDPNVICETHEVVRNFSLRSSCPCTSIDLTFSSNSMVLSRTVLPCNLPHDIS